MTNPNVTKSAKALSILGASKGGIARAQSMTAEERAAVAKKAAEERWARERNVPKASHEGMLPLGDYAIPCAVLDDGKHTRVISERGMAAALGHIRSGSEFAKKTLAADGAKVPVFLQASNLSPFISEELAMALSAPRVYRSRKGGKPAHGIEASLIPAICDVFLNARAADALTRSQMKTAMRAEVLVRALARVGIIALVDEATGYQADRARDELQRLLDAYIAEEMRPWVRRFPNEFFEQIYRLQGWKFKPGVTRGPRYVGKLINEYVYKRLPPGVLDELRKKNPVVSTHRKHKHFQFLTDDVGDPHLERLIASVTTLMRASTDKGMFKELVARALPVPGQQEPLALGLAAEDEDEE